MTTFSVSHLLIHLLIYTLWKIFLWKCESVLLFPTLNIQHPHRSVGKSFRLSLLSTLGGYFRSFTKWLLDYFLYWLPYTFLAYWQMSTLPICLSAILLCRPASSTTACFLSVATDFNSSRSTCVSQLTGWTPPPRFLLLKWHLWNWLGMGGGLWPQRNLQSCCIRHT